jgi:hypothetical protein
MVYTQSNYLLKIAFNALGQSAAGAAILVNPLGPDNDPTRQGHLTGDRWCVLDGAHLEIFYLAGVTDSEYNDVLALLALYWGQEGQPDTSDNLYQKLLSRFNPESGVLAMDPADQLRNLYPVYKVALLGIVAKTKGDAKTAALVRQVLVQWQDASGGWITDRTPDGQPNGLRNLETTTLATLSVA